MVKKQVYSALILVEIYFTFGYLPTYPTYYELYKATSAWRNEHDVRLSYLFNKSGYTQSVASGQPSFGKVTINFGPGFRAGSVRWRELFGFSLVQAVLQKRYRLFKCAFGRSGVAGYKPVWPNFP